jgi:hypothetical protein
MLASGNAPIAAKLPATSPERARNERRSMPALEAPGASVASASRRVVNPDRLMSTVDLYFCG